MEDDRPAAERAELVRQAQAGDRRAFAHLAQRHGRAVYAIALAHLGRTADAEDVAQASLLAALEHLDDCRDPARFDAWLFAIARNRARRALLRRRLRDVLPRITPEPPDPAEPPQPEARSSYARWPACRRARVRWCSCTIWSATPTPRSPRRSGCPRSLHGSICPARGERCALISRRSHHEHERPR
ncbi:MAG: sigma-70 family RNA polymerase sigma factor [Myxococcales bacterium]|nr:sigma-70 family RNA polymerase sigma factor [Myxococcales bacterium]